MGDSMYDGFLKSWSVLLEVCFFLFGMIRLLRPFSPFGPCGELR